MDEAATSCSYRQAGSVSRKCVLTIIVLHRAGDRALRRRSIKLLFAGSAFRVSVSGLVLGLNGGRRAQPQPLGPRRPVYAGRAGGAYCGPRPLTSTGNSPPRGCPALLGELREATAISYRPVLEAEEA